MKTLRFHRVDNKDYPRYHGVWFKKFAKYCEQFFNVEWVDYAKTSDQGSAQIELLNEVDYFGKNPAISDADCVIENLDNGEYVALSFTEYFNSYIVHLMRSEKFKKLCLAHFNYHNIYYWVKRDSLTHKLDKVTPWFFGSAAEYDVDYYRRLRTETTTFNEQLFFKGGGVDSYRKGIKLLHERQIIDNHTVIPHDYFTQLATTKCALSYYMDLDRYYTPWHHPGELCYRDIEYMAIGTPFIRIEYKDSVYNGFIPNYHYISIPREYAYDTYNKHGDEGVIDLITEKHSEIIHDDDLLKYISTNQTKWFDTYARWPNSAAFTIQLTEMDKWI